MFDPLCMTVSTNKDNAKITLECIEKLNKDLGVKTVLGVSNVSFGLPNRELLNSTFFTLAMQKGLSAGIINPKSDAMMNAYYSFCALNGLDDNFEQYIANVTDTKAEIKTTNQKQPPKETECKEYAECIILKPVGYPFEFNLMDENRK